MISRSYVSVLLLLIVVTSDCFAQDCDQLQSQYDHAKSALRLDARALNSLGFAQTSEDLEDWAKEGEHAQKEASKAFTEGLMTAALTSLAEGTKTYGSLNPWNANVYIKQLKTMGIDLEPVSAGIREVARVSGKPQATAGMVQTIEQLKRAQDAISILPDDMQDIGRADLVMAVAGFAGTFVQNPELNLTLATASFMVSLGWSATSRAVIPDRINQFLQLNDQQLQALVKIQGLVRQHVSTLKDIEGRIQSCAGIDLSGAWLNNVVASDGASCLVRFQISKVGTNRYSAGGGTNLSGDNCAAMIDESVTFTVINRQITGDGFSASVLDKNTIQGTGFVWKREHPL